MSISTLPHQILIRNNKLLQYSLPAESMETTGHVSASRIVCLNFSCAVVSSPHIQCFHGRGYETNPTSYPQLCVLSHHV
ncbi:hypothetical protein P692DRAFT_20104258 [Suillus brevipes Sb2]|nr:hypothetical protein P692DRAFT_20104258 [Suillus brevipes Sb2]